MKRIFAGLSLAGLALAIPFYSSENAGDDQVQFQFPLGEYANYPGYDLDLNELRLVQLEGREPMWVTEYEKVGFRGSSVATLKLTSFRLGRSNSRPRVSTSSICESFAVFQLFKRADM